MYFGDYVKYHNKRGLSRKVEREGLPHRYLIDNLIDDFKAQQYEKLGVTDSERVSDVVDCYRNKYFHIDDRDVPFLALRMLEHDMNFTHQEVFDILYSNADFRENVLPMCAVGSLVNTWAFPAFVRLMCRHEFGNTTDIRTSYPDIVYIVNRGYDIKVAVAIAALSDCWRVDVANLKDFLSVVQDMCDQELYKCSVVFPKFYYNETFLDDCEAKGINVLQVMKYLEKHFYAKDISAVVTAGDIAKEILKSA